MPDMNFAHSDQLTANSTEISVTLGYMLDALRDIALALGRIAPEPEKPVEQAPSSAGVTICGEIDYFGDVPDRSSLTLTVPVSFDKIGKLDRFFSQGIITIDEAIDILKEVR